MTKQIGVEQYVSLVHQQEHISIRIKPRRFQCTNRSRQGIVGNCNLYWRMVLCIVDEVLFGYTLVNTQHGNTVFTINGLVLDQCHVRHGDNGWNRVAYG